jgi:hypothetical protein
MSYDQTRVAFRRRPPTGTPYDRRGPLNPKWRGGMTKHPLYDTYLDMIGRCHRPSHARFADYGGRGISVCTAWRADFWRFVADMGERPSGLSLDRIDNDGGYEPSNVRWATRSQQMRNRRPAHLNRQRNDKGQWA